MSLLNHARLNAVLSMSQQHQAQLIRMITTLLADIEKNISQLQSYAKAQQRQELQQALHKIRGGYATLGAEDLARISKEIELTLEHQQPFSEPDLAEFIAVYRQSGIALQAEITKLQPGAAEQPVPNPTPEPSSDPTPDPTPDIVQLYYLLRQQDMQACDVVQKSQAQLQQLLTPSVAQSFCQQVFALDFSAAAATLLPFLPPEHRPTK